jgi:catechol 2,3-dioxygenase-like lactoylglutathione lyase family enzyme
MTNTSDRKLIAFAAVSTVNDVARSLEFYLGRLGFKEFFRLGDPPSYAIVERDAVSLHLMPATQEARGIGRSTIYVFAADVDALHDELCALGCAAEQAPTDYDYGMREFSVRDPDGNRITFGQKRRSDPC